VELFRWEWSDPALSLALNNGNLQTSLFFRSAYTQYPYYLEVARWAQKKVNSKVADETQIVE